MSDGVAVSNTGSSTLDTVHVAPTITAGGTVSFEGGGSAVALDSGIVVADPDSGGALTGATITVGSGFTAGDILNFGSQNGITGLYDTGTLTLSGTASIENYESALASITYSFFPDVGDPTAGGGATSRTIDWTINDGVAVSNTGSSTLDTVHIAPAITASGTVSFTGGGSAVALDTKISITAPDSGGFLTGATVAIGTGFTSGDILNFGSQNGITGLYDSSTGTLTLSGTATTIDYRDALNSVTYGFSPGDGDPTAGARIPAGSSIGWSTTASRSATPAAACWTRRTSRRPSRRAVPSASPAVARPWRWTAAIVVTDPDSGGDLTGATISIGRGFATGDTLNFDAQDGIVGVYGNLTGILTLSGTASTANYESALASITYSFSPNGGDPTAGREDTSRAIHWTINDGVAVSNVGTVALDIVHAAPTVTAGATVSFTGGGSVVALDSGIVVTDPDSGGNLTGATISIGAGFTSGDILNFGSQNGITGEYATATGILTLSGAARASRITRPPWPRSPTASTRMTAIRPAGGDDGTSRAIGWVVNDSVAASSPAASVLDVMHTLHQHLEIGGAPVSFTGGGAARWRSTTTWGSPLPTAVAI